MIQPTPMTELDTLFPVPQKVQAGGRTLEILPLTVRQIAPFIRAIGPALVAADAAGDLLLQGAPLAAAVAVAIDEAPEWVAGLPAADYLRLATAVMEANADFFGQLRPALEASTRVLERLAGPTPSPSSPPPDTGSTM